jgi:hypothetical protein
MVQRIGASAGMSGWRAATLPVSERRIGMSHTMPARCQLWLRIVGAQSAAGPQVSVLASLLLSPIHVRVIHRAVRPGDPHPEEIALTLPLVPANEQLARPSRTFRGPAGGSRISLQLFDHERSPLTEERELGGCIDGIRETSVSLLARVHPAAWISPRGGHSGTEPTLRLEGELVFVSGIGLRVWFRPLAGDAVVVDIALASVGTTLHFADRVVERGLPGLPAILLAFLDAESTPIGRERLAHLREE